MMYHHEYGAVARVPGSDLVLVTEVRGDNSGPHKPEEIDADSCRTWRRGFPMRKFARAI